MPWQTPTLKAVRSLVRDNIRGSLPGADALVPNSVLRVLSDSQGALCHLTLQYIDWLALQLMPDTAETEWLDRHGNIWLVNADGTTGRKLATLAAGTVNVIAITGSVVVPAFSQLTGFSSQMIASSVTPASTVTYETLADIITAADLSPTPCQVRALDPGAMGNLNPGDTLAFQNAPVGIVNAIAVNVDGGTDTETDDELRMRVLKRIRQPPQGGDATDYEQWALAVAGCTRAWCKPLEMGIGTVTVRVLFDDLRADNDGWPRQGDLDAVTAYIDSVRPVAVKDFFVVAPVKQFINVSINNLVPDNDETRAAIETNIQAMLRSNASPGQTIFAVWKAQAIMNTANVISFDMRDWTDDVMLTPGNMAVLQDIFYD
jgi:uncharacterized phage protein gp47/JayE